MSTESLDDNDQTPHKQETLAEVIEKLSLSGNPEDQKKLFRLFKFVKGINMETIDAIIRSALITKKT